MSLTPTLYSGRWLYVEMLLVVSQLRVEQFLLLIIFTNIDVFHIKFEILTLLQP